MWNDIADKDFLTAVPVNNDPENLQKIQSIIDVDKYESSLKFGWDLCGDYAPFCNYCDKQGGSPCAVSYVKMKLADNASPVEESALAQEQPVKKRIRIAVAKRKH